MYANVLAFAAGVWALQQTPALPLWQSGALLLAGLVGVAAAGRSSSAGGCHARRAAAWALAFAIGFAWAAVRAELRLADQLAAQLEGEDLAISGVVRGLPARDADGQAFEFEPDPPMAGVPSMLGLRWYAPRHDGAAPLPVLEPGQRWQFAVRLKRPHVHLNPHARDSAARLLEHGLRATGYVRARPAPTHLGQRAASAGVFVERLRYSVRARFERVLEGRPWAGMAVALALGDHSLLDAAQWSHFQALGIVHLAVVSGLHVSLVAMLCGLLAGVTWRRAGLCERWPASKFGVLAGLVAAWAYALLAGFGIPVQRAVLMLSVVALGLFIDRRVRALRVLALALLAVLLIDPWAVIAPGFWLSFVAVGLLLLIALGGRGGRGRWATLRVAIRTQWAINLAMVPALLLFFQQFSVLAPLANLIAVPVVGMAVLPLCLLAVPLPADSLLLVANALIEWLMVPLGWLAASGFAAWYQAAPPLVLLLAATPGCLWAVLPRGTPGRWAGVIGLLPLVMYQPPRPPPGAFELTVLDVGQGLAVHVRTARHDLLFDTGPRWPTSDAGQAIVVPYLRAEGVQVLDMLVLSHADTDHAGGAGSVAEALPVRTLVTHTSAEAAELSADARMVCRAGEAWRWDGVALRWVTPPPVLPPGVEWSGNNRSCGLMLEGAGGRALLLADSEQAAERVLVGREGRRLEAELLVVPHHGSRSSSSDGLVEAVLPRAVVYSVGYRSRFGHPHPEVWARWAGASAVAYRTDSQGAIRARFDVRGISIAAERELRERYWQGR